MSSFISNNQNRSTLFCFDRNAIIAKYRKLSRKNREIAIIAKMVLITEK